MDRAVRRTLCAVVCCIFAMVLTGRAGAQSCTSDCPLATFAGTISWNGFVARSGSIFGDQTALLTVAADGRSANYSLQTASSTPSVTVRLASCEDADNCADPVHPGYVITYAYADPVVVLQPGETRNGVDFTLPDVTFQTIAGQVQVQDSEVTGGSIQLVSNGSPPPGLNGVFIITAAPVQPGGHFTGMLTRELLAASFSATVTTTTCARPLLVFGAIDASLPEGGPLDVSVVPPSNLPSGSIAGTVSIPGTGNTASASVLAFSETTSMEDCAGGSPFGFYVGQPGPYSLGPLTPGSFLVQAEQIWSSATTAYDYRFAQRRAQVASNQTVSENFGFSPAVLGGTIDLLGDIFGSNADFASFSGPLVATGNLGDSLTVQQGTASSSISYQLPLDSAQQWNLSLGALVNFSYPAPQGDGFLGSSIAATLNRPLPVSGAGPQAGLTENDFFRPVASVTMAVAFPPGDTIGFAVWQGSRVGPDNPTDSIQVAASATYSTIPVDLQMTLLPGKYGQEGAFAEAFGPDFELDIIDVPPMSFDVDSRDVVVRTAGSPDLADLLPAYGETCSATSTVSGVATAVRGGVAGVAVQGVQVSATGGAFHRTVVNPIGHNTFTVSATNTLGQSNVQQRTLVRPFTVRGFLPNGAPLVPAEQTPPAPTSAYKAGATIALKVEHDSCGHLVATKEEVLFPPRIASVQKIGDAAPLSALNAGTAVKADSALFRFTSGGTWMNNLSTKGWSPGNYLITLEFADGRLYRAMVALR
jgi:hypothetical protein